MDELVIIVGRDAQIGRLYVVLIINQYKRMVTITARQIHAEFAWQARFYDHIIRDAPSYHRIKHYIVNNPKNWTNDGFNKNG